MFTYADKGAVIVAIKKIDYKNKMLLMLSDESSYRIVDGNPLEKMQLDSIRLINTLE